MYGKIKELYRAVPNRCIRHQTESDHPSANLVTGTCHIPPSRRIIDHHELSAIIMIRHQPSTVMNTMIHH